MSDEEAETDEVDVQLTLMSLQKKIRLLMGLLLVTLLMAMGGGAYAFMSNKSLVKDLSAVREVAEKLDSGREDAIDGMSKAHREVGEIHHLGTFVVNLLDANNLRYVNLSLELEVEDEDVLTELNRREVQLKDTVISTLGNLTFDDVQGVEGKARLREELMVRFNRLLTTGQIARIYFTEFVVQ